MFIKHSKQTTYTRGERTAEATEKKSCLNQDLFYVTLRRNQRNIQTVSVLNFSYAIFSRLQEKKKQAGGKNVDEPLKKEQVFQCEASGNEVGGSVPDAETRFQQVLSTAKTPAALTHRRPKSAGFSSAFVQQTNCDPKEIRIHLLIQIEPFSAQYYCT